MNLFNRLTTWWRTQQDILEKAEQCKKAHVYNPCHHDCWKCHDKGYFRYEIFFRNRMGHGVYEWTTEDCECRK